MLTIEIELLGGRYAATAHNDRGRAEWPPHPARFFSALVAAFHEKQPGDPLEREALLWLERQPPPALDVDLEVNEVVGRREVLDVYVPVNDVSLVGDPEKALREARAALAEVRAEDVKARKKAQKLVDKEEKKLLAFVAAQGAPDAKPSQKAIDTATALLPERRTRQMRTFPVVLPRQRSFTFVWQYDPPAQVRTALDTLCARVTHLGHSSSLVRCLIVDKIVVPNLVPTEEGEEVLRVIKEGQLDRLEREHLRHRGVESRVLPALPKRYGRPRDQDKKDYPCAVFSDEWIVFERVGGARLSSSRGHELAQALRRALIEQHGTETLPESLSGHRHDGSPATTPHAAFVALPFVGHEHSDGSVLGCAIVLPRGLKTRDRETLLRLAAAFERDRGKKRGGDAVETIEIAGPSLPTVELRRTELSAKKTLDPSSWSRPARRFITATPIALDRNPGNLRSNQQRTAHRAALEAQRCIADACERIGLPRPESVEVSFAPLVPGAQPAHSFRPAAHRRGRPTRVRAHAHIEFAAGTRVRGPVILGAGRFFGLGLCLPIPEQR